MAKEIYLDYAAAAPLRPRVEKKMTEKIGLFANPSSFNDSGRLARQLVKEARIGVAKFLGAHSDEVIFTSSGSEANNLAIFGASAASSKKEIITTPIEHPSVLESITELKKRGYKSLNLGVDNQGLIKEVELEKLISKKTFLVSIMFANNEIGTLEPIVAVGKIINQWRKKNQSKFPYFHVDACQAAGFLDCNVNRLGVDLLTFNASKIGGPKGIGVLYVRRGIALKPLIFGGDQEGGLRAGTENVLAIVGLAEAILDLNIKTESERLASLRDYFLIKIKEVLLEVKINGAQGFKRLPNNIHLSVPGVTSESLLIELDKYGIRAGSGSACTSHSVEPSHVLKAIKVDKKYLEGALRVSMGWQTKKSDMDYLLKILPKVVSDLKQRYRIVKK